MSTDVDDTVTEAPGTVTEPTHRGPLTTPSVGKGARNIDPDANPWERQHGESNKAYTAFVAWRDSEDRKLHDHGSTAQKWSSQFSWGYRAFEYDRWLARKDAEDMVRYRRTMNDRQRRAARLAQQKVAQWLINLDASTLTASEAAKWLEVAVKIERLAGGGDTERLAISAQGRVEDMTAEETSEALSALMAEIHRVMDK